ncbi:MAG: hypothetical protein IJU03_02390 [Thermoguttaceae bacterium]|nr:hypothetical protein [Thermoguttaceae bacterium]
MELEKKVCYLGDDDATRAAAYLCGIMTNKGIAFDRVNAGAAPSDDFKSRAYSLYVISDYCASCFKPGDMEHIVEQVRRGSGLLMLGGWESYFGRLGEYHNSPLAEILPVVMANADDRRNYSSPVILRPTVADHPILSNLPWSTAPGVGGFNRFDAKEGATILLEGVRTQTTWLNAVDEWNAPLNSDEVKVELLEKIPFLVVDSVGAGRVAAFASDVAPHWIGGMVDWGTPRIFQELPEWLGDGLFVEIGCDYAQFFDQLVRWTGAL